jgi:peptidyl-prolyl cis-trans isomerase C
MQKGMVRVIALLNLLLLLGGTWAAAEKETEVLATLGEETITLQEFLEREPALASWFGMGAVVDEVQTVLEQMIFYRLLAREAFQSGLANQPRMRARVDELLAREYLRSRLPQETLSVAEAEIRDYYDSHLEQFRLPPTLWVAHILVASEEEAQALRQAVPDEETFGTLAMQRSLDPASAQKRGDLGWVVPEKLAPRLAEIVLTLEPGQMSEVVKTEFGYHLVRLQEKPPPTYQAYEAVKKKIHQDLLAQKRAALTRDVRQEFWTKAHVAIHREVLQAAVRGSKGQAGRASTTFRVVSTPGQTKESVRPGPAPQLRLLSEIYNLGPIPAETVTHTSLITNSGDADLIIERVQTTCRCAEATISPERLSPGQTGKLTIIFDPNYFKEEGQTTKIIYITSNDPQAPQKIVYITAEVLRGQYAKDQR